MTTEQRLPDGWHWVALGDLGEWRGGGTPSKARTELWTNGTIPWVSPKDMKSDRIRNSEDLITPAAIRTSAAKLLPRGAVLVVTRSGILEHTLPVAVTEMPLAVNQDLKALTPSEQVTAEYAAWALRAFERDILQRCSKTGTTVASIEFPAFLKFRIPVAPPAKQAEIVDNIERQVTRIDAGATAVERVEMLLAQYITSILIAATTGRLVPTQSAVAPDVAFESGIERLRHLHARRMPRGSGASPILPLVDLPPGWAWATVGEVGDVLIGRQRAPQYLTGKHPKPYLRVANIKDDYIDFRDVGEMDFAPAHLAKYSLNPGDVLVSEGQSPALLGQSAIYRGAIPDLCFQNTLLRFRPVPGGPSAEFAQIVFRSHVRTGVFRRLGSITTNIAHLTLGKFKGAPFPLPPPSEQDRIVAACNEQFAAVSAVRATVARARRRCDSLRSLVLSAAFRGDAVGETKPVARLREHKMVEG